MFQNLYLHGFDEVQIGTGNDPSDVQSVITTFRGFIIHYAPADVFVGTNEMWFTITGAKVYTRLEMEVEIISIDLHVSSKCVIIINLSYLKG